jgi:hypothetical protein
LQPCSFNFVYKQNDKWKRSTFIIL